MCRRILLLGDRDQLGWKVRCVLALLVEVVSLDYPQVDFDPQSQTNLVYQIAPQVIYNAVDYTAVDRGESKLVLAQAIIITALGVLAETASNVNALLIHFSTDYVYGHD